MTFDIQLDETDRHLLTELQAEARLSYAELGRRIGLSPPAVAERMRRLEERGLITGYRAGVDLDKLGFPIRAFVRLTTEQEQYPHVIALARRLPAVLECHHLAGGDSFILLVAAPSVSELEATISRLGRYGQTTTSLILSTPVRKQIIRPTEA